MNKTLQVQQQIRNNAEEISTNLSTISQWEKDMKQRDDNIKKAHLKSMKVPRAPIRSGVGTIPVESYDLNNNSSSGSGGSRSSNSKSGASVHGKYSIYYIYMNIDVKIQR